MTKEGKSFVQQQDPGRKSSLDSNKIYISTHGKRDHAISLKGALPCCVHAYGRLGNRNSLINVWLDVCNQRFRKGLGYVRTCSRLNQSLWLGSAIADLENWYNTWWMMLADIAKCYPVSYHPFLRFIRHIGIPKLVGQIKALLKLSDIWCWIPYVL